MIFHGRGRTYWEAEQDARNQLEGAIAAQRMGENLAPAIAGLFNLICVSVFGAILGIFLISVRPIPGLVALWVHRAIFYFYAFAMMQTGLNRMLVGSQWIATAIVVGIEIVFLFAVPPMLLGLERLEDKVLGRNRILVFLGYVLTVALAPYVVWWVSRLVWFWVAQANRFFVGWSASFQAPPTWDSPFMLALYAVAIGVALVWRRKLVPAGQVGF